MLPASTTVSATDSGICEECPLKMAEHEVRSSFRTIDARKPAGPDGIPGTVLNTARLSQLCCYFETLQLFLH